MNRFILINLIFINFSISYHLGNYKINFFQAHGENISSNFKSFMASKDNSEGSDSGLFISKEPDDELPEDTFGAPVGPLPSVSSKINYAEIEIDESSLVDLWIVGSGTLGTLVADEWLKRKRNLGTVIAETKTTNRHTQLKSLGAIPKLRTDRNIEKDYICSRNVLICLPPSSAENTNEYVYELFLGCRLWAGPKYGQLLFTSSTAVYGDSNGNTVTETFRTDTRTARATKMLAAEDAILYRGGSVMRLAGLYTSTRGPHTMWIKSGAVDSNADGIVNMLHYEDAASAAVEALVKGKSETIYLVSDDEPVTRMDICKAGIASGLFPNSILPKFKSETGPVGKTCDSSVTKEFLKWEPKYPSFQEYMYGLGGIPYQRKKTKKEKMNTLWIPGSDEEDDIFSI